MIWQQSWIILDHKPKVKWWIQKRASQVPQEGPQPQGLPQKRINLSVSVVCSVHGLHWILRVQSFHSWIDGSQWFSSPGLPSPLPQKPIEAVDESTKRLPRASSKSVLAAPTNQKRDFKSGDSPSAAGRDFNTFREAESHSRSQPALSELFCMYPETVPLCHWWNWRKIWKFWMLV